MSRRVVCITYPGRVRPHLAAIAASLGQDGLTDLEPHNRQSGEFAVELHLLGKTIVILNGGKSGRLDLRV